MQDTLLAAVVAGRDEPAWLAGVMRKQALLVARGTVRRRRRESTTFAWGESAENGPDAATTIERAEALRQIRCAVNALSPALRRVAMLALHGLDADEIRWILRLTPTAFRQRLTALRRAISGWPDSDRAAAAHLGAEAGTANDMGPPIGPLRRTLKAAMADRAALGTHDHDGHPLLVRSGAHT